MKNRSMALAMVLSLVLGASAVLAQSTAPAARPMGGTISKIDGAKITYTPRARGRRGAAGFSSHDGAG